MGRMPRVSEASLRNSEVQAPSPFPQPRLMLATPMRTVVGTTCRDAAHATTTADGSATLVRAATRRRSSMFLVGAIRLGGAAVLQVQTRTTRLGASSVPSSSRSAAARERRQIEEATVLALKPNKGHIAL